MDEWENFMETSLPKKEKNYSNLDMEDVKDADYLRMIKEFEKSLR